MSSSFFDTVPLDPLGHVVQHFAENPFIERWVTTVNTSDALLAIQSGGSLGTAAIDRFKSYSGNDISTYPRPVFASFLATMAPVIESLFVYGSIREPIKSNDFRAVRALDIESFDNEEAVLRIFQKCGGSLRELRLHCGRLDELHIRIIARNCTSLAVLDLNDVKYEQTLEPVWRTVGDSLRELYGLSRSTEFVHISRHCTNLEKLGLYKWHTSWSSSAAIDLFKSLRNLQVLIFPLRERALQSVSFTVDSLNALLAVSSPNMCVHSEMEFRHSDTCVEYIRTIGPRLRVLDMQCELGSIPCDMSDLLENIEELTITPQVLDSESTYASPMESMFEGAMPNLHKLSIHTMHGPRLLSAIARSVTSLRDFECSFALLFADGVRQIPVKSTDFQEFLEGNKQLSRIHIDYGGVHGEEHDTEAEMTNEVAELIRQFRKCPALSDVSITYDYGYPPLSHEGVQKIRNACVPMRCKRIGLVVNGSRFLPATSTGTVLE